MRTRPVLTTRRLELTPFDARDREELLSVFRDPSVRRFLLDDQRVSETWLDSEIATSTRSFSQRGCGLWAVKRRGHPRIIGFSGYRDFHDPPELQLVYGLLPEFQGRGFATEATQAVITHGFDTLGFDSVVASTDAPNEPSIRVMERLGMSFEKRVLASGIDTIYYRLHRGSEADGED